MYITKQLEKLIIKKDMYGRNLIMIPNPRFIVFYNGIEKQPEIKTLYLSTAYEHKEKEVNLELKVLQLNINKGYNENIKNKCPSLFQYMQYVEILRENLKNNSIKAAVIITVEYCIEHDILRDFLLENKAEVISMSIFEYDEELHKKTLLSEGYEDGYEAGRKDGYDNGHKDGYDNGRKDGYDNGHKDGYDNGHKDGYDNGHKDGYEAGVAKQASEIKKLKDEIENLKKLISSDRNHL